MKSYRVSLPNFGQIDTEDQTAILSQLVNLFAGPIQHCRFITLVTPANLDQLETARRRVSQKISDPHRRRGMQEEVRMISDLGQGQEMREARHYFIDFDDTVTPNDLAFWRISAEEEVPNIPVHGHYLEKHSYMVPIISEEDPRIDNTRFKYGIMASHQLSGTWDWKHPLVQALVEATGPMVICVDCKKLSAERVAQTIEFWDGMTQNGADRKAAIAYEEASRANSLRDEAIHHMRVLFMLLDKDEERLKQRLDSLRKISTRYMRIDPLSGFQKAASEMFGPTKSPSGMPAGHYNVTSSTAAAVSGLWAIGREQPTDGFYVGISADEVAKNFYYLNWKGNDPFHGIVLGMTGKGKTVGIQSLCWRLSEQGVQAIFLEPNGHSKRLRTLAKGEKCAYHKISYEHTRINILDVVHNNPTDQLDHVITLLGLLLDPMNTSPRVFTNPEIAAIRQALMACYENLDWHNELMVDRSITPTLTIFCQKLDQVATQEPFQYGAGAVAQAASGLAEEIRALYVFGDYAAVFNTQSNLDLSLKEEIILFDFSQVPEARRALFYYATLAGISLQIRRHPRKRVIAVDELHYMSSNSRLLAFLATLVKTVRTFGAAVVMIDQDLEAFIGTEANTGSQTVDVASGQFILNNISWVLSFGLKREAAFRLQRQYPTAILPSHAQFLANMGADHDRGKGMAVVSYNGKADTLYLKLRPMEASALFGS